MNNFFDVITYLFEIKYQILINMIKLKMNTVITFYSSIVIIFDHLMRYTYIEF